MRDLIASNRLFFRLIRHVLLFISMVGLFGWVAYSRAENGESFSHILMMVTTNAIFFFGYAYLTNYLLIPYLLFKKRYLIFGVCFIFTGLILSWLKFTISDYLFYEAISSLQYMDKLGFTLSDILVNTKDMTFIVAVFSLFKFSRDNYMNRSIYGNSEVKRLEAEMQVLDHQLDPHVIFNNFNNLYSISINRPDLLLSTIRKLKSVLEYLFLQEKDKLVSLKKELSMIENYIGLERLRFGERLQVKYIAEGNFDGVMIAPLLLYAFIENCFEYGAGLDTDASWIDIRVEIKQSKLMFTAANSLPGNLYSSSGELYRGALENSFNRLEMLYPNSHRLTIREKQNEHKVELQISL